MNPPDESFILHSWNENAVRWNALIDEDKLESRRLATNEAIVQVLRSIQCEQILDVGCGEGWLVRRMNQEGRNCLGIDGSSELIQLAQSKGQGTYQCLSYGDIIAGLPIEESPFECIVFNFALFGKDDTAALLRNLQAHLTAVGKLVIQSLHPDVTESKGNSSWKADVWKGLPGNFTDTYAWYQRSMEDWKMLFRDCQLHIEHIHESFHPHTQSPLSVIFVLTRLNT